MHRTAFLQMGSRVYQYLLRNPEPSIFPGPAEWPLPGAAAPRCRRWLPGGAQHGARLSRAGCAHGVFVRGGAWLTRNAWFLLNGFTTVAWIYSLCFKEVLQMLDSGGESSGSGIPGA